MLCIYIYGVRHQRTQRSRYIDESKKKLRLFLPNFFIRQRFVSIISYTNHTAIREMQYGADILIGHPTLGHRRRGRRHIRREINEEKQSTARLRHSFIYSRKREKESRAAGVRDASPWRRVWCKRQFDKCGGCPLTRFCELLQSTVLFCAEIHFLIARRR